MSEFDKAQDLIDKLKGFKEKNTWLSSKLYVMLAIVGGIIFLVQGNISLVLWQLTALTGLWLLCRTAEDIMTLKYKSDYRLAVLKLADADGNITDTEKAVLEEAGK